LHELTTRATDSSLGGRGTFRVNTLLARTTYRASSCLVLIIVLQRTLGSFIFLARHCKTVFFRREVGELKVFAGRGHCCLIEEKYF
jgi:hypothetical protein